MKDFCFFLNDDFCYKHLKKVDSKECTFKSCDEYVMASCTLCNLYHDKECSGNKDKSPCEKFKRKKSWAFEEFVN